MTEGSEAGWVSLKEASARAGVSISWLRKQYRHNGLATRDIVGPRGRQIAVPLEEVVARAAVFSANPAPTGAGEVPAPRATAPGSDETQRAPDLAAMLLDRLFDAQSRAARAEAESAYLLLRLDDAYAEIEQLRARLTD